MEEAKDRIGWREMMRLRCLALSCVVVVVAEVSKRPVWIRDGRALTGFVSHHNTLHTHTSTTSTSTSTDTDTDITDNLKALVFVCITYENTLTGADDWRETAVLRHRGLNLNLSLNPPITATPWMACTSRRPASIELTLYTVHSQYMTCAAMIRPLKPARHRSLINQFNR